MKWLGPNDDRELAKKILSEKRFAPSERPQPLRRPLAWLGEQISNLFRPFGQVIAAAVRALFSNPLIGIIVLVAVIVALFFAVRNISLRRSADLANAAAARTLESSVDPSQLEGEADSAEQRGEHDLAVRLRFKAGLIRLAAADRVPRSEATNGELRWALREAEFDELADDFDEIVYGGRPATAEDAQAAKQRWPKLTGPRT